MTVIQVLENSQEATVVDSYFSTVTGRAVLLKQDLTMAVLVKTFQNF